MIKILVEDDIFNQVQWIVILSTLVIDFDFGTICPSVKLAFLIFSHLSMSTNVEDIVLAAQISPPFSST